MKQKLPPSAGGLSLFPLDCAGCHVSSSRSSALCAGPGEGEHSHVLNIVPNWITQMEVIPMGAELQRGTAYEGFLTFLLIT